LSDFFSNKGLQHESCFFIAKPCISGQRTKSMAFKGRDPVRTKTVIDNKIIEQVNLFKYVRNVIFYERELDIDNK
jgi:hypothetical protein